MLNYQSNTQDQEAQPLVTFIVTYYNLPVAMLCQCLDSILALSLSKSEREIIVVDDGSDESPTGQLGRYLGDIVYVRQPNAGLSGARNRGIQMSNGQYLQFVDADDYLIQTPYEHCLDLIRYQKPDVVMFDLTDDGDNHQTADFEAQDLKSGTEYLSRHNLHASACGYLLRRAILGKLQFTNDIYHEDEEFTPQLLLRCDSVVATTAKAYLYRKRDDSIVNATSIRHRLKRLNDFRSVIERLNKIADTLPTESRLALQRRVHQLAMDYIYNVILLTQSRHYLDRQLKALHTMGLYPLPRRNYTKKYVWFRRLANTEAGLSMLMRAIPLMKKER